MDSRILYIAPINSLREFEAMKKKYKDSQSAATIVFQNALLQGFKANGVTLDIVALPIVSAFPKVKLMHIPGKDDKLESGYTAKWVPSINIPVFKQKDRENRIGRIVRKWIQNHPDEKKTILVYSVYAPAFRALSKIGIEYGVEKAAIITDLPQFMYTYEQAGGIKKKIQDYYAQKTESLQGGMDKYIYLTDAMHRIVAPDKPYIVMEGIAGHDLISKEKNANDKPEDFIIMYAGALNLSFGIGNLLEAFHKLPYSDVKLWLFGNGDAGSLIKDKAEKDSRICFFGSVSRAEILQREMQADLLVNVRDPREEFTKYSFASKNIEYMASGTPYLTTRLEGIPEEYYEYVLTIEDNSADSIAEGINKAYMMNPEDRMQLGKRAKKYVLENKNSTIQAGRIMEFILSDKMQ